MGLTGENAERVRLGVVEVVEGRNDLVVVIVG